MRSLAPAPLLLVLLATQAHAQIAKWEHPDGRVGFAAKAADVPAGAVIVSGSLTVPTPVDPPVQPPAAPAQKPDGRIPLCDRDASALADILELAVKELDWEGELAVLGGGRECTEQSVHNMAVNFKGACQRNVSRGLESEGAALQRVVMATLFDCIDYPRELRERHLPPDPGAR